MTEWTYTGGLGAGLRRGAGRVGGRARDRDGARLLSPWRGHRSGPDTVVREG